MIPFRRGIAINLTKYLLLLPSLAIAVDKTGSSSFSGWKTVEPGYARAMYQVHRSDFLPPSEISLLRFSLAKFMLVPVYSKDTDILDAKTVVEKEQAIAAINANFFDDTGHALGLVVRNGICEHPLQLGGSVLTGVFLVRKNSALIVHRSDYPAYASAPPAVELAIQSGPRLITNGRALMLRTPDMSSRRSGIAVTRRGEVLLFATHVRFPGATLRELQQMLTLPQLNVQDALNLDGGGSSQLFVMPSAGFPEEVNISGGDLVPVMLAVKKRTPKVVLKNGAKRR